MRRCILAVALVLATFAGATPSSSEGALLQTPPIEFLSVSHSATNEPDGRTVVHDGLGRGDVTSTLSYSPGDTIVSTITLPPGQQLVVTPGPGPMSLDIQLQTNLPDGTYRFVSPEPAAVLTFGGLSGQAPGAPFYLYQAFIVAGEQPGFAFYFQWTNLTAPFSFSSAQITMTVPDGAASPQAPTSFRYSAFLNADETFSAPTNQPLLSLQSVPEPTVSAFVLLLPLLMIHRRRATQR